MCLTQNWNWQQSGMERNPDNSRNANYSVNGIMATP